MSEEGIRERMENHDRSNCWTKNKQDGLYVVVNYMNNPRELEGKIRDMYTPSC